ncbi:flagellar hook-length control protein FliK [Kyrpidia sp.]|uniref:flagellar hook-length control protein FliK n=1 Tax=Kyrpidia sp. TaxID=2073077 RepID=UPI00258D7921|nr:flagellar hook-length control protein FliK [Kyrpidia sp.]MCL6574759.1 flagellar hook-length control protein FliK [Kyrpidia sp.]
MSEATISGATIRSPREEGQPTSGKSSAAIGAGVPHDPAESQVKGARRFTRVLESHLPGKGQLGRGGKTTGKKKRLPGEAVQESGNSPLYPGGASVVFPGSHASASGVRAGEGKRGGQILGSASMPGKGSQSAPSLFQPAVLSEKGKAENRPSIADAPDGSGAPGEGGITRKNAVQDRLSSAPLQGTGGQNPGVGALPQGGKVLTASPGTVDQSGKAGATHKTIGLGGPAQLQGAEDIGNAVVGVEAWGRGIPQDPPTVQALAAREGRTDLLSDSSFRAKAAKAASDAPSHRAVSLDSGAGRLAGDDSLVAGLSGGPFPGQGMQEPPTVLTNVPSEGLADAVGANLANRAWRPGESATLRVTVVPADLGPVQVIAHMDVEGRLHVQIHAASPETQAMIQQQSMQLIHHLQQNHIPVQRLDVGGTPIMSGGTGSGAAFTGGTGTGQGQPHSGFQPPVAGRGTEGAGVRNEGVQGPGDYPSAAGTAVRLSGTSGFEAMV